MVAKKSLNASLDKKKSVFLLMGFVVGLSLLFICLEWSKEVIKYEVFNNSSYIDEGVEIIQTVEKKKLPPTPPPPPIKSIENIEIVENTTETKPVDFKSDIDPNEKIDIVKVMPAKTEDDGGDVEFRVVEEMPQFPGNIFKFLSENIHYPIIAIENNVQGQVICQFLVNKDGTIDDISVIRGVDRNLDKEAIRVIQSMPKWNPGKQRGKAVKVRYTLPITFRLM
ncbi:MAG: energy transducer TonB [Paludibacter sp.]|nr:energy transducer TonB [Paludibacter sp.]